MTFVAGNEPLYSLKDAAARVGVSYLTVWYWVNDNRLPAEWIGRQWIVREGDLLRAASAPKKKMGRPRIGTRTVA